MAFTLNRRLAQLVDSNGQLNTGKIPNDYITSDHIADNTITSAMLHTGFTVSASNLGTTLTPTFGNITTTGYIAGPATFTIDPAAVGDNTGTVVIAGNLQVDGTTTTINSTTMEVDDLNITLASGAANAAAADGAGLTVDGASATLLYQSTPDAWSFNKNVGIGTTNPLAPLTISNSGGPGFEFGPGVTNFGVANTNYIASYDRSASTYRDISFDMGGTESNAIRFQTGGKVGIGTSSPDADLHIAGTNDNNLIIQNTTYQASNQDTEAAIRFKVTASADDERAKAGIHFKNDGSDFGRGDLYFTVDSNNDNGNVDINDSKMIITHEGNLLVNQTSAGTNGKLQITGDIGLTGSCTIRQSTNSDTGDTLRFLGTQFVAGSLNSMSYGYSGGGQIASLSASANALLLDVGANNSSGHRFTVQNDASGVEGEVKYTGSEPVFILRDTRSAGGTAWSDSANEPLGEIEFWTSDSTGIGPHAVARIRTVNDITAASPSGAITFMTSGYNNGSPTEKMRINSSGYVTTPSQPYIRCAGNYAGMAANQGTTADFSNWSDQVQRGITRSGAVFTVPVAGEYLITYSFYFWIDNSGPNISHVAYLYKGSSSVQETIWESNTTSYSYADNTKSNSLILNMAVGDTFKFVTYADVYGGSTHTNMSAYLLG